jgi:hypothetical protein
MHISVLFCQPYLWDGFIFHVPGYFTMTIGTGFRSPLLVTYKSVDPCLGLHLNHLMQRSKSQETSIAAVGVIIIMPDTAMQTNLCSLPSSKLLCCTWSSATKSLGRRSEQVSLPWCKSRAKPWVLDPTIYQMCPYRSIKPCRPYHIFQLCLSWQSSVQSKSKALDLGSQLQFVSREG